MFALSGAVRIALFSMHCGILKGVSGNNNMGYRDNQNLIRRSSQPNVFAEDVGAKSTLLVKSKGCSKFYKWCQNSIKWCQNSIKCGQTTSLILKDVKKMTSISKLCIILITINYVFLFN